MGSMSCQHVVDGFIVIKSACRGWVQCHNVVDGFNVIKSACRGWVQCHKVRMSWMGSLS